MEINLTSFDVTLLDALCSIADNDGIVHPEQLKALSSYASDIMERAITHFIEIGVLTTNGDSLVLHYE